MLFDIAPTSAIKKKGGEYALPKSSEVGAERREDMDKFTLEEFWLRSMEPVYNLDTGELITTTKMDENRNLEVVAFWICKDGIGVKLGNKDMEDNE